MYKKRLMKYSILIVMTIILVLPQLITKNMVIGSDSIFHFNRFYDTAMQIKNHNFQYFISIYGFQQSARIVNPFYGPLFAYIQGLIVLVSKTRFRYQMLSNALLYFIALFSMNTLLGILKIKEPTRSWISFIYLGTYAIQYWVTRQGFTSWGAAFLPLCLIPLVNLYNEGQLKIIDLGCSMAWMIQVHLFTGFLLLLIYFTYFSYFFIKSVNKKKLIIDLFKSILLFFLLSSNLFVSLFEIYRYDPILAPFVNQTMYLNTITANSYYWLFNPVFILFVMMFVIKRKLTSQRLNSFLLITIYLSFAFVGLSSNLLPWEYLLSTGNSLIKLIQFPFRFFVPATVFLLISAGLLLNRQPLTKKFVLPICGGITVIQIILLSLVTLSTWSSNHPFEKSGSHTVIKETDLLKVKRSFYDSDLAKALYLVEKPTPDYLPIYPKKNENYYELYQKNIADKNGQYQKDVTHSGMRVVWTGKTEEWQQIPVIAYHGTKLSGKNGKKIAYIRNEDGTINVKETIGENSIIVSHPATNFFSFSLAMTLFFWTLCGLLKVKRSRLKYINNLYFIRR